MTSNHPNPQSPSGGSPLSRWAAIGIVAGAFVGVLIVAALLFTGGDDDGPAVVITPVAPTAEARPQAVTAPATSTPVAPPPPADATPTATPEATGTPAPTPTPDDGDEAASTAPPQPAGAPTVFDLRELRRLFGEAPDATLGRLRIPVLGVDAPVGQRYVDQKMPNPTGPGDVVWYDFSEWDGLGGVPGGGRNAVFSGHVDYNFPIPWAEAHYRGEGVFFDLRLLSPGDVIEVEVGGKTMQYTVKWTRQIAADGPDSDWLPVLTGDVPVDSITLITCGGEFDVATKSYRDRFIVRAERA